MKGCLIVTLINYSLKRQQKFVGPNSETEIPCLINKLWEFLNSLYLRKKCSFSHLKMYMVKHQDEGRAEEGHKTGKLLTH